MSREPLAWIDDALARLEQSSLLRVASTRSGGPTATVVLDGTTYVNFSSNDYLGLATDDKIERVVAASVRLQGWGSGASPVVTGRGEAHAALEAKLATFERAEAALLLPTGYGANAGTIPALVGRGDSVFSDAKNHASIIDGCRLSGARIIVFDHGDVDDLRRKIATETDGRRLIVTDGLFSMDGDLAPLPEIADIADEYGAMLMVDEAHATGVFGQHGRGVCEYFGVESRVSLRVGTLSKALGSHGGFVVAEDRVIQWLRNRARSYVFSTAAPDVVALAGIAALDIVHAEPERRVELLRLADRLRERLRAGQLNLGQSCSQIVPIFLGSAERTIQVTAALRDRGFLVPGIRPPSVPVGESLLRISVSYAHSPEMIEELAETILELV